MTDRAVQGHSSASRLRRIRLLVAGALMVLAVLPWRGGATTIFGGKGDQSAAPSRPTIFEPLGEPDPAVVAVLSRPGALAEAKRTFTVFCTECHGLFAGGGAGPNLTDLGTLWGARYEDIVSIVTNGSPNRPMPSWRGRLADERIRLVAAYVYSLRGSRAEP